MLDFYRIGSTRLATTPFPWYAIDNVFEDHSIADQLRREFPIQNFTHIASQRSDKSYSMRGRVASIEDELDFSPLWRTFMTTLRSELYWDAIRKIMGNCANELFNRELSQEISLWRYSFGDGLAPHLDKEEKVITQIFYFCEPEWSASSGGCLEILAEPVAGKRIALIEPKLGHAVTLVRTERSWHSVTPQNRKDTERLSVQVVFHNNQLRYSKAL